MATSSYVPIYRLLDFSQGLPKHPDFMEPIEGNKRTGYLRYRDPETGQTFTVPNIHYNQRSESELSRVDFYIEREERLLATLLERQRRGEKLYSFEIPDREKQVTRLKARRVEVLKRIADRDAGKLMAE